MAEQRTKSRPALFGGVDILTEQGYQAAIHCVVNRIGRHLGFQAFNVDTRTEKNNSASPIYTPATIFLATDHLHHLLVKNYVRRDKAPGTDDDRFERAIYRLHAGIFQAYHDWCNHVQLVPRLPGLEYSRFLEDKGNVLEWEYLLEELALYFLIYSEAANLRHMPEALWFIYWIVRNSHDRMSRVTGIRADSSLSAATAMRSEDHRGVMRKQVSCRNTYHREIESLRTEHAVKADGNYKSDREVMDIHRRAQQKLWPLMKAKISEKTNKAPLFEKMQLELQLAAEMVAYGDSGAFLDRIVEPIFNYLAVQVDQLGSKGQDIQWRVAYDDCNESLCSKEQVHSVLKKLGIKINRRKRLISVDRDPYSTLCEVALQAVAVTSQNEDGSLDQQPVQTLGWDRHEARLWWERNAFGKTFIERRSWLSMGRAFFRVWLFLVLEFQAMCVFLWAWDTKEKWYWLSSLTATHAVANLIYEIAGAWTQRSTKRHVRLLGSPFWRHYARGILDWIIICAALGLAFTCQRLDFFPGVKVWWYTAGGYAGLVVIHAVLIQRDGYCISLTHGCANVLRRCGLIPLAWIFEWIGASSARGPAEQYLMPYRLKTGWGSYLSNALFWIVVLGAKCVFDWYAVMQTMRLSVIALFDANWLGSVGWDRVVSDDPDIPPRWVPKETGFDLDIILCIGRVLPGFLVVMNDTQIFYYIIGALFGVTKGLLQLNLGSITSFQELVLTFHKAPMYWWRRGMSNRGKDNIARQVQSSLSPDLGDKPHGAFDNIGDVMRRREAPRHADLVSEQVFDATAMLTARSLRRDGTAFQRRHLDDAALPLWVTFADVWNGIVDELRQIDLVSNAEAANLRFVHIEIDQDTEVVAGMRPIMMPVFFYGGQVTRAMESPGNDPTQGIVLSEIRALLVFVLSQTGILTREQAEAFAAFTPLTKAVTLDHRTKRLAGIKKLTDLLVTMKTIMLPCRDQSAVGNRSDAITRLREELLGLADVVDVEIRAVLSQHTRPARGEQERDPSRLMHARARVAADALAHLRQSRLDSWEWRSFWGENGGLEAIYAEAEESSARANVAKVVNQVHKMLTTTAKGAQPRGDEAQRVLAFFMGSLKNPTLETPPAIDDMLSWTVLTPHYEEDVLYALSGKEVATRFGLPGSTAKGMSDLMSENEDGVTVMAWLRSNYPQDWANLLERLAPALAKANIDGRLINEADFAEGGPLSGERMSLLTWASYRGQLLARTVRGMMAYESALRLLARIENPNPNVSQMRYNSAIDDLVRSKFTYVVASQRYGDLRKSGTAKGRWLAQGVEDLLQQHLALRVAFLDSTFSTGGNRVQHSVLVRGRRGISADDEFNTEELYRIRLPVNFLQGAGHGVILGEGKPENQNASIIFCFGEVIQAIDMNQDNYLCEALKMRNLISEFNAPQYTEQALKNACAPNARRRAGPDAVAVPVVGAAAASAAAVDGVRKSGAVVGLPPGFNAGIPRGTTVAYERPWPDMRSAPVTLVGFREWVFSQDSGALASFAAATEFTFGSMIQRIMTWPGSVRFHYGHPDLWNKLFVMTRGGVSKATRAFHISEDVFAGYNHVLRGGRVKFKEYISCGKGRDMGFDSINSFESKVSGGNGEQVMSRDVFRLGTHFDFFRLLAFYHSGPGFFINSYLVLLSVYANMWMLAMLALTGTQSLPNPENELESISTITGQPTTVAVQQVVQIGMFSIITYAVEMILEYGAVKALGTLFYQILQGSLAFFVFRSRTTAYFFLTDVQYGGAKYIPTGRGYQLKHNSFVKVYSNYARSHLYYAAELLLLLILLALLGPQQYAVTTWSTWLVAVSILWAPFWFNPGSFLLEKTKDDFEAWLLWMQDVVDPDTGTTWDSWNKTQLEKPRNEKGTQTNPLATKLRGVLGAVPTTVLTLGAVTNLEDTRWNKWIVFGVLTGVFWFIVFSTVLVRQWLVNGRHYRVWRLVRTGAVLAVLGFMVCAIIFVPAVGSGMGLRNLVLIMFANFSFASVVTQTLLYLAPRSLRLRNAVDVSYRVLDYILGYFLFTCLSILSFLQVFNAVQGALLYNIKFSRKLDEARMMGSNNYITSYVDRATERINNNLRRELQRTTAASQGTPGGTPPPASGSGLKQA